MSSKQEKFNLLVETLSLRIAEEANDPLVEALNDASELYNQIYAGIQAKYSELGESIAIESLQGGNPNDVLSEAWYNDLAKKTEAIGAKVDSAARTGVSKAKEVATAAAAGAKKVGGELVKKRTPVDTAVKKGGAFIREKAKDAGAATLERVGGKKTVAFAGGELGKAPRFPNTRKK